jgi:THO complex subunit 5
MKKDLLQEKEELLKESKAKLNTMDNIKTQIEILVKVCKNSDAITAYSSRGQIAVDVQKKVDELALPIPTVKADTPG